MEEIVENIINKIYIQNNRYKPIIPCNTFKD